MKKMKMFMLLAAICLLLISGANGENSFASGIPIESETATFNFSEEEVGEVRGIKRSLNKGLFASEIIEADIPFSSVGVHWKAELLPGTKILIEVKTSKGGELWTEWQQVNIENYPDETPKNEFFGHLISVDQRDETHGYIQYRVRLIPYEEMNYPLLKKISLTYIDSGVTPPDLIEENIQIEEVDSNITSRRRSYSKPSVVSRAGWGCDESLKNWTTQYRTVTHVVIHHTAGSNSATDYPKVIRDIYYYHAITRDWGDIGYNYLVAPNGVLYEGRYGGDDVVAGHAYGYNTGSMGLSFMGTYTSVTPSNQMLDSAEELLAWKCDQRSIDPLGSSTLASTLVNKYVSNILGHRDVGSTECPGSVLYNLLPTIRSNVKSLIDCDTKAVFTAKTDGLTAIFDITGSHGDLDFDYGDSNTGGQTSHTYSVPGTYTVTLTATGIDGCTDTMTKDITVVHPGKAYWTWTDETGASFSSDTDSTLEFEGEQKIRLMAEIPDRKILRAYNFTVEYDPGIVEVIAIDDNVDDRISPFGGDDTTFTYHDKTAGIIETNGLNSNGIPGDETYPAIAITELTIVGLKDGDNTGFSITANQFGADATDKFIPTLEDTYGLTIIVGTTEYEPGDADLDGDIDIFDALLVAMHSANLPDFIITIPGLLDALDVDSNGEVDINDALAIARYDVGLQCSCILDDL
ncbi:MAG: hypothetical protein GY749_48565 [Desulfobacteraceae bacterium]|nr:hypothetical protein [Desulfobacteraceae bacterium]